MVVQGDQSELSGLKSYRSYVDTVGNPDMLVVRIRVAHNLIHGDVTVARNTFSAARISGGRVFFIWWLA